MKKFRILIFAVAIFATATVSVQTANAQTAQAQTAQAQTATAQATTQTTRAEYIEQYKSIARDHQERYGIPASIKMAQGLLESNNGNSRLATMANNHFGIKCKSDWTGRTLREDDDAPNECFRAYPSAEDSWADHSEFLDKGARYQFLFDLPEDDYVGWANGLKAAGYATNPRYPELLIKLIEENGLYYLDRGEDIPSDFALTHRTTTEQKVPDPNLTLPAEQVDADNFTIALDTRKGYEMYVNNGSQFIIVHQGDDLAKLAWRFGVSQNRLRKFNDLGKGQDVVAGIMLYVQPKATRAESGKLLHTVTSGETLHSISQLYGIRLARLARLNRIAPDTGVIIGQQVKLR